MTVKDSGTSWIVLGVVTLSLFLEVGLIKSFSVLLPDIKEQFATHTWVVGSSISIILTWGSVIGLSADYLVNALGPRVCIMVCGILSSLGLIISTCAPNPFVFLLGLILTGCVYLQEIIALGVIPYYFDAYYKIAVAVYCCGSGIGIIVMPILTQFVLSIYGWRGALLLLTGLNAHTIPCGVLLHGKPLPNDLQNKELTSVQISSGENQNNKHANSSSFKFLPAVLNSPLLTNISFLAQVMIPGFVWGYTYNAWLIYIVSFALSKDTTISEASIVATCGGIGLTLIRALMPLLQRIMTDIQLMHVSSCVTAIALALTVFLDDFMELCFASVVFGAGFGILGAELYVIVKEVASEDEYVIAVAWLNLVCGFASIASGFLTGYLFDITGSFSISFTLLAAMSLVTSVSLGLEETWMRMKTRATAPI